MAFAGFNNRDDVRWSHPDIAGFYEQSTAPTAYLSTLYSTDLPLEERLAARAAQEGELAAYFAGVENDFKTVMAAGCPEEPDAPEVEITLAYPKEWNGKKKLPLIIIIPGGGLATCETMLCPIQDRADEFNCVAATFKYRTVLDGGGYPQTVNDCHAAYQYLVEHAEELRINDRRIVIEADSSGGHMALSLSHRLKRYGLVPRGVIVYAPILDERTIYPSSKIVANGWGGEQLYLSSKVWLGDHANPAFVPAEAFANHATVEDCIGLPPTIIHAFANDSSYDPTLDYVSKLSEAGTFVTLHLWGGSNHDALYCAGLAFIDFGETPYGRLFNTVVKSEIKDLLENDLRRPWTVEEASA